MKKMIMLLAILLIAGVTQAASVTWSVAGNTFAKSPDDASGAARARYYTVLIFAATDQASVLAQLGAGNVTGVGGVQSFSVSSGVTTSTGATGGDILGLGGATYQMFAIAFDTWGAVGPSALADANHYNMSSTLTANTYEPPAAADSSGAWAAANWTGGAGTGTWTAVVPEPTSMALLALGAAAIGLRRRFKK